MSVIFANLSSILSAAVDDERIPKNPCRAGSLRLPRLVDNEVVPWTFDQFAAVRSYLPDWFRVVATLAAGCGLRQGEVFGLAVKDIDFLRNAVHVRRQVKRLSARAGLRVPEVRQVHAVPLPETATAGKAAHLAAFPAVAVTVPWNVSGGAASSVRLVLSTREGGAVNRN